MANQEVVFLQGEKIHLRLLGREDLPRALLWFNDPEVRVHITRQLPLGEAEEEAWFATRNNKPGGDYVFAIVLNDGNRHIGNIGLHSIDWIDSHATFGIVIGETEYQEKGVGTEAARLVLDYALNELGLHRVNSRVIETNVRSLALHRKLGFVQEGRQRQVVFQRGRRADMILFGMFRDELRLE